MTLANMSYSNYNTKSVNLIRGKLVNSCVYEYFQILNFRSVESWEISVPIDGLKTNSALNYKAVILKTG